MACLDVELCDKIDVLIQNVADTNFSIANSTSTVSSRQDAEFNLLTDSFSLVLGFLAFFLFLLIIKFLYNFFKGIF